jgi:hypothetical protein
LQALPPIDCFPGVLHEDTQSGRNPLVFVPDHREMLGNAGFTGVSVEHDALTDGMGIVSAKKQ